MLANKVTLVTGASRNTGWAIAQTLASHGAHVCLHDIELDSVRQRAEELRRTFPEQMFLPVAADLREAAMVQAMFEAIEKQFGRLDVFVANAAHQGVASEPFADLPIALFEDVWATNVRGHILCAQHAVRLMDRQGGTMVFLGSNTAERAIRDRSAYIASKGAISALTRALALDLGPLGIRVNEAAPGYINTERWATLAPEIAARRRANLPLGREATAGDVGELVAFLASDRSGAMTGARISLSAGIDIQMVPQDCEG